MEPRIQYAKTSDGVSIAYCTVGKGTPFVQAQIPMSNMAGHSRVPEWNAWNEQIARRGMLVRYDCRGSGHSDREVTDYSLDAWLLDLEAVVESLALDQLILFAGGGLAGPVAIAYAARWPERVSHLILWMAWTQTAHLADRPGFMALLDLVDKDWELFTETIAHTTEGWSEPETARISAQLIRENQTPEGLRAAFAAGREIDVSDLLSQVTAPTLVLHRRESFQDFAESKKVASGIRNARLVVVDAKSESWAAQRPEAFADIADSTALTESLGDAAFRAKARELDGALRSVIREHAGTTIEGKLLGDGVLAVFTSARQAIEAAIACASAGGDAGLPLHLGLHAGDVLREENNVYGGAVNTASRIAGLSAPGEVLVSETVRSLARTSGGVSFEDRGRRRLKGIGEPVRVWAVREAERSPSTGSGRTD